MGPVIFVAIVVVFIGFRIWLISQRSQRTDPDPEWVHRLRSPKVAFSVILVVTGIFALLISLDVIPRWVGAIAILVVVLTRFAVGARR